MNYFWIRIFDYNKERDRYEKGILLDEYYAKGDSLDRETVKLAVKSKNGNIKFSKPKKEDGPYAIVMDSEEFYYDYFYKTIDDICFKCHKPVKGAWRDFPREEFNFKEIYFCSYDCKNSLHNSLRFEGEFQEKELVNDVAGYIYHIYNRIEDKHYIGQTKYLPFFRWQEHIKAGGKGSIEDLTFEVITEVRKAPGEEINETLNNIEAWWIKKYKDEGYKVMNISNPKLTMSYYKELYESMKKESQTVMSL
ncbi:hypothetical protein [Clostridium sp.]|uniref:hypothetical protein n=1 Tax=Clostridium sp. TaxID=1506 RepID=UPI002634A4CE|nr:hypothetical protein [Clostridium sp.]